MADSKDRYSTEKVNSAQSAILYNCEVEALSKSIHPCQSTKESSKKLEKVMLELNSFQSCIRGGYVQVKISPVQSNQVVYWVLAKSSPINQLSLA
ncbi:hypothetical protein F2Q68_00035699 [Brassica cretica]|uniref:Uncharacterized protein n=1 Tax=Brassica cretica TaxID=69181 RepID=A0A8S9H6J8_BRACR|nr:hypothetical protein F2Q68_00035699 [Brassica cretica]